MSRNPKELKPMIDLEEEKLLYLLGIADLEEPSIAGLIIQNRKNEKLAFKIRFKYANGERYSYTIKAGNTPVEKFLLEAEEIFNGLIGTFYSGIIPRPWVLRERLPDDNGVPGATVNWLLENDYVTVSPHRVVTEGEGYAN